MSEHVPLEVGDVVRYKHGHALYLVTAITPDDVHLIDMATGRDWGNVTTDLALVMSYGALYQLAQTTAEQ